MPAATAASAARGAGGRPQERLTAPALAELHVPDSEGLAWQEVGCCRWPLVGGWWLLRSSGAAVPVG
eukprot:12489207-Alexandrium_andersonii.AAC.1